MSVTHRIGETPLLPSHGTRYRALHRGNTANLSIFSDAAKYFFTLSNIFSHSWTEGCQLTNRN